MFMHRIVSHWMSSAAAGSRSSRRTKRQRLKPRPLGGRRRLSFEALEDRRVLAAALTVDFTGEEITDLIVTLPDGADFAVIEDDGTPHNGMWQIRSTSGTFATTSLPVPSGSLTINATDDDTVVIDNFDGDQAAEPSHLTLNGLGARSSFRLNRHERLFDNATLTLAGNVTLDLNGKTETIAALSSADATTAIALGGGTLILAGNTGATTFAGSLAGSGKLTKSGKATLTLSGDNTYTGPTIVSAGTLKNGVANALSAGTILTVGGMGAVYDLGGFDQRIAGLTGGDAATGTVTSSGAAATLTIDTAAAHEYAGVLTGDLSLTKTGAGTLTLSNHNTYLGETKIVSGTLRLRPDFPAGARIMPLGDSITSGKGGTNAGYRGPLYSVLADAGYNFQFVGSLNSDPGTLPTAPVNQTYHEGHGGWKTGDVAKGILRGVKTVADGGYGWLTANPDIVLLHIGTNNVGSDEAQSVLDVSGTLDQIHHQRPTATTYVAQIIPKKSGAAWIKKYNLDLAGLVADKQAAGYSVFLVDMHTNYPPGTQPDGVHPDDAGYAWMAEQWRRGLLTVRSTDTVDYLPTTTRVAIAGGAKLELSSVSQTIASLTDYGGSGGSVISTATGLPVTLTIASPGGSAAFSGTIRDGGAAHALSLVKTGGGTQVLSGANTYSGPTTIRDGTLVAASSTALGGAQGTTVLDGGTLGLQGGVTISNEPLTLNGNGSAGRPGALVNLGGNNTLAASSPILAEAVSLGQIGIGSVAGTLTVKSNINLQFSQLNVAGDGDVTIQGVIFATPVENLRTQTQVFANVPEARNYLLAYEFVPSGGITGSSFPYTVDNTAILGPFDRVAYYLELDGTWVYASMDTFTADITRTGVPYGSSRFKFQQKVTNLNVLASAGSGIVTGTGLKTGNIEIWPSNYGPKNSLKIPNADPNLFDFGDTGAATTLGYGSFQVHNHDLDGTGPGTTGQTLLAYNNWRGVVADLGIGTNPDLTNNRHPDWTYVANSEGYAVKRMAILVHETNPRLAHNALVKSGGGTLILAAENEYPGPTTVTGGTLLVNGAIDAASTLNVTGTTDNTVMTIGGFGTVRGPVDVSAAANGRIHRITGAAVGTVGTLTIDGTATLGNGSVYHVDVGGDHADRLTISGAATIRPGAKIRVNQLLPLTQDEYILAIASSGLDTPLTIDGLLPTGYRLLQTPTRVSLVLTDPS